MHFPLSARLRVRWLTIPAIALLTGAAWGQPADAEPSASLVVMPAVIDWPLVPEGRSGTAVRVANLSDEIMDVQATLRAWRFDADGGIEDTAPSARQFAGRVLVVPERLRLEPGARRTLRLWIEDAGALDPGEHRALLSLSGFDAGGTPRIRLDLAVYAQLGPVHAAADLVSASWSHCEGSLNLEFKVGNSGNRHVRMEGWLVVNGTDRFALPRTPVLPGEARELAMRVAVGKLAPTSLRLEGSLGQLSLDAVALREASSRSCDSGTR